VIVRDNHVLHHASDYVCLGPKPGNAGLAGDAK
jgi:hypothetical protein